MTRSRARYRTSYAPRPVLAGLAAVALGGLLSGCSGGASAVTAVPSAADTLRLGYFGNVTHAPALVAVGKGFLRRELGATTLETQVFNAGPAAIEALNAGAVDAAYIGPGPAINAFVRSNGETIRIVSGATSGGAQLVVKRGITSASDLRGKNLASPQLGGSQDVALRAWLSDSGLANSPRGGGDVTITPTENAQALTLFRRGEIDGAWLPEPWASRLVLEAGAKVLVDERTRWPGGRFVTTHLVVATKFLREHPQTVAALVRANIESIDWINEHPAEAQPIVNEEIAKASGQPLDEQVLARAFDNITLQADPLASTLPELLSDAVGAGLLRQASLDGIYDLRHLNKTLTKRNLPAVSAAGLGEE